MFRLFACIILFIEYVHCTPVNCQEARQICPYGYEQQDGCEICKCYDPCNPSGKAKLCANNQQCLIEKSSTGEFLARCDSLQFEQNQNICEQEKLIGYCKGLIERYFYNSTSGQCEEFIYGGCGGNENNFKTIDACEKLCMK